MAEGDRNKGKSNSDPGESRECVTEDKIGGLGWRLVLLYDCRDRRLHPRPGRSVKPGATKLHWLRSQLGCFNIP